MSALSRLCKQSAWVRKPEGKIPTFPSDKATIRAIFDGAIAENRDQLTTEESLQVLKALGIRLCKATLAKSVDEALSAAKEIGYPVVLKITSKTTSHKTDVGGVRVGIDSDKALIDAYNAMIDALKSKNLLAGLEGILVQEQVEGRRELVCGLATDPQYGPMLMFGLGGVFVETLKDVTFDITPITDVDAHDMVRRVKAFKLLEGARSSTRAQIDKVEETLLKISQLVGDFPEVLELDVNPLMICEKTGEPIAVDARIRIRL